jgi:hypothetical protein
MDVRGTKCAGNLQHEARRMEHWGQECADGFHEGVYLL